MNAPIEIRYQPLAFHEIEGWASDGHAAAYQAFHKSCARLVALAADPAAARRTPGELLAVCRKALSEGPRTSASAARRFFETHFSPHRPIHRGDRGLVTGYYEPVLAGSRTPDARFTVPIRRRPPDLVNLVDEADRATVGTGLSHARRTPDGVVPYATRAQIEDGALSGLGLEFFYVADPVDKFFMQVQGSGRIRLPDETFIRLAYDGKNGHPYTSIGRHLIDTRQMSAEGLTLATLGTWLRRDPARARPVMNRNESYVFFRELPPSESGGPLGALGIPLTPGRSLAVDTAFHALGLPIFVTAPALDDGRRGSFRRLMIAQDVGSAIKGPERGDLYFGSGFSAGRRAGRTKHAAGFILLLPRARPGATP